MRNANINCKCNNQGRKTQLTENWVKCSCGWWRLLPEGERPMIAVKEMAKAAAELFDSAADIAAELIEDVAETLAEE